MLASDIERIEKRHTGATAYRKVERSGTSVNFAGIFIGGSDRHRTLVCRLALFLADLGEEWMDECWVAYTMQSYRQLVYSGVDCGGPHHCAAH